MLQKQRACIKKESQHQPETAAEAAVHKYFDGSRLLDAAGEAEGGVVRKAAGNTRGGRGEERSRSRSRKTLMVAGQQQQQQQGLLWSK